MISNPESINLKIKKPESNESKKKTSDAPQEKQEQEWFNNIKPKKKKKDFKLDIKDMLVPRKKPSDGGEDDKEDEGSPSELRPNRTGKFIFVTNNSIKNSSPLRERQRSDIEFKSLNTHDKIFVSHSKKFKLIESVRDDDVRAFRLIFNTFNEADKKSIFFIRDSRNRTLLHLACFYGRLKIIEYMISKRKIINDQLYSQCLFLKDDNNYLSIDLACVRGYSVSDDEYCTASQFKNVEDLPSIIEGRASLRSIIVRILLGEMNKAIQRGYKEVPRSVISRRNYVNTNCPLHWAIYWGDLQLSIILIGAQFEQIFWVNKDDEIPFDLINDIESKRHRVTASLVVYVIIEIIEDRLLGLEEFAQEIEDVVKYLNDKNEKKILKQRTRELKLQEKRRMEARKNKEGNIPMTLFSNFSTVMIKTAKKMKKFVNENKRVKLEEDLLIDSTDYKHIKNLEMEVNKEIEERSRDKTEHVKEAKMILELSEFGEIEKKNSLAAKMQRSNSKFSAGVRRNSLSVGPVPRARPRSSRFRPDNLNQLELPSSFGPKQLEFKGRKRRNHKASRKSLIPIQNPDNIFKKYDTKFNALLVPKRLKFTISKDDWTASNNFYLEKRLVKIKNDLVKFERSKFIKDFNKISHSISHVEEYEIVDDYSLKKIRKKIKYKKLIYLQRVAVWYAYFEKLDTLLKMMKMFKISPFMRNTSGKNIIHLLCYENRYQLLHQLININYSYIGQSKRFRIKEALEIPITKNLNTPAHICIYKNSPNILFILLEVGVNLQLINQRGWSCSELFVKFLNKNFKESKEKKSPTQIYISNLNHDLKDFIREVLEREREQNIKKKKDGILKAGTIKLKDMKKWEFEFGDIHFDFVFKERDNNTKIEILEGLNLYNMKYSENSLRKISMKEYDYCIVAVADAMHGDKTTVYKQLQFLAETYQEDGGIELEIVPSYDNQLKRVFETSGGCCWAKKKLNLTRKFFYLIQISDELMNKVAKEMDLKGYNMLKSYSTQYPSSLKGAEHFEPLRDIQKQQVILYLLRQEFDLKEFRRNDLLKDHFPVNNFKKMKTVYLFWWNNRWKLLIDPIFRLGKLGLLRPFVMIGNYNGLQNAYFFAFLNYYTSWILMLCIISSGVYIYGLVIGSLNNGFMPFLSVIVGVWGTFMEKRWTTREIELAHSFGTLNEKPKAVLRHAYTGRFKIDKVTNKVTKHNTFTAFKKRILTEALIFAAAFTVIIFSYMFISYLTGRVENNVDKGVITKMQGTYLQSAIGVLNSSIIFVINTTFEFYIDIHVKWENHKLEKSIESSRIFKKVIVVIFSTFFTLIALSIEKRDFNLISNQVVSGFISNSILNIFSVNFLPYLLYKYNLYQLSKKSNLAQKTRRQKFLKSSLYQKLRYAQYRYETLFDPNSDKKNPKKAHSLIDYKELNTVKIDKKDIFNSFREQRKDNRSFLRFCNYKFSDIFDKYWEHEYSLLKQEQLERSLIMFDLKNKEELFYQVLAIQYGWITLFLPFFPLGAFVAFISNMIILLLTAKSYESIIRRSASKHMTNIGIWKNIFIALGYLGVMYNAVTIIYPGKGLPAFLSWKSSEKDIVTVLVAEHAILIVKFLLSLVIPVSPKWVHVKIQQERYREKSEKDSKNSLSKASSRTGIIRGRMMSDQF